jgi:hypothetical protein
MERERPFRRPFVKVLAVAVGALTLGLGVFWAVSGDPPTELVEAEPGPEATGRFYVHENHIIDPEGRRFIVKGTVVSHGAFAGGDEAGFGATNYATVTADLDRLRGLGFNTVRVLVTPRPGDLAQEERVRSVVDQARARGFVVELGTAFTTFAIADEFLAGMARRYRRDPYVWLQPMNEPNCPIGPPVPECSDWALWQRQHRESIRRIRAAGNTAPIVVNAPGYSAFLSKIDSYPLGDDNIVWGAHRYANAKTEFGPAQRHEERHDWADRSLEKAVIVDEVGGQAVPEYLPYSPWLRGFIDFVAHWVNERDGSGAIAFVWHWSDANTMTDAAGGLTPWGRLFLDRYVRRVPGRM